MPDEISQESEGTRWHLLHDLEDWLEKPMLVLSAIWLVLVIVEFTRGLSPALTATGTIIWVLFIIDFALRLVLAPRKWLYLRRNALTAISLLVPALRILRIFRAARILTAARAVRGVRLVRVIGTLNRGMRAIGATFARRGFGYIMALTIVAILAGAAGMLGFERGVEGSPIRSYWDALWWTSMIMTTMGSDYFPRSAEGRMLCVLLALYAFAVFGYVTATLATFFIDRDAADPRSAVAGEVTLGVIRDELRAVREELAALRVAGGGRS